MRSFIMLFNRRSTINCTLSTDNVQLFSISVNHTSSYFPSILKISATPFIYGLISIRNHLHNYEITYKNSPKEQHNIM
jgi:hypothetical protein